MRQPHLLSLALAGCGLLDASTPGNLVRPTVDDDPTLPALDVNGTRLHVRQLGPAGAPVMIFLHGGPGGDLAYLQPLAERVDGASLADDHRLVFWDQRGTGLSRRHGGGELGMEVYHRDLEALVDAVSPGAPVVMVGHSWGAAYAARFMGHHPERVRGAVLVNMVPLTRALADARPEAIDEDLLAEWLTDPMWIRGLVSPDDHARADFLLGGLLATPLPRMHNSVEVPNLRPGAAVFQKLGPGWRDGYDFTVGLAGFPREVLLVAGDADEVLGTELQVVHARHFARPRLARLAGAGHNDPLTVRRVETVRLVRAYLAGLE